jgi:hypothetical protein
MLQSRQLRPRALLILVLMLARALVRRLLRTETTG